MSVESVASQASSAGPTALQRLGCLTVPLRRFSPSNHIAELTRLLDPRSPRHFSVRSVGLSNCVWVASRPGNEEEGFTLKQVAAHRRFSGVPTDVESCDMLLSKFPSLLSDKRLAFPHSVIHLKAPDGEHVADLIVARQAPGVQLGHFLAELDLNRADDQQRLERVCSSVGELLADFHARYENPATGEATYHTDFHPSNVLYEPISGTLNIVDLTGMGSSGITDDVEKFARLIGSMAGERYAAAFRLRYIALAKPSPSQCRSARSSTRSTAASSCDGSLLYPLSSSNLSGAPRAAKFQRLSSLVVPATGFNPEKSLTTLAWLLSPGKKVVNPVVQRLAESTNAWLLSHSGHKECWILQQGSRSVADSCEELVRRCPQLLLDEHLSFPYCVIPLQVNMKETASLLVSRAPCSVTLQRYVTRLNCSSRVRQDKLNRIMQKAGHSLALLHHKFPCISAKEAIQDNGLRPGIILYDEDVDLVCFSDFVSEHMQSSREEVLFKHIASFAGYKAAQEFKRAYTLTSRRRSEKSSSESGLLGAFSCVTEISDSGSEAGSSDGGTEHRGSEQEAAACCLM
eukprot:TRINITY_DN78846_c0_g1_i1.p1 TRINITY_DN78846_c0_g1~~TRINITY_DN78846_c0_g1_i1.p1  ORF type:complete len:572 (-),score=89.56 TRINITY_DN78846_c0_g1_i1:81-1796(-)